MYLGTPSEWRMLFRIFVVFLIIALVMAFALGAWLF